MLQHEIDTVHISDFASGVMFFDVSSSSFFLLSHGADGSAETGKECDLYLPLAMGWDLNRYGFIHVRAEIAKAMPDCIVDHVTSIYIVYMCVLQRYWSSV